MTDITDAIVWLGRIRISVILARYLADKDNRCPGFGDAVLAVGGGGHVTMDHEDIGILIRVDTGVTVWVMAVPTELAPGPGGLVHLVVITAEMFKTKM